ncbi:T6SS phospholipase effector Tle1-like catalytic domain-containing protein [Rhizobium sp. YIM 134829]|uniref:T6SS phospholipase effector Tle1-like catalytic domain-containing protein n=1 Tax=Rhizobium sp. YIM 134829 TaxID=3390453 RepID=UPI0039785DC5
MAGKRLIVLLDGTWNDRDEGVHDTNIVRLQQWIARSIEKAQSRPQAMPEGIEAKMVHGFVSDGRENIVFYESGVGTDAFDRLRGGLLGRGLPEKVRRAYKFLAANYAEGDSIFIFGFSRGAFTARSLVGYLGAAGLLKAEYCTEDLEPRAWAYYRTAPQDRLPGTLAALSPFTHDRSRFAVDCIGVFDTVGALGVPLEVFNRLNRQTYAFHNVEMSSITRVNLHAMAIDEHRQPFRNTPWRKPKFKTYQTTTEQVWFSGAHADIGGGYIPEEERSTRFPHALDDIALDWMVKRLAALCPNFPCDPDLMPPLDARWALARHHEPRTGKYRLLYPEAFRSISNYPVEGLKGRQVAVSRDRQEWPIGEMVHISALIRLGEMVEVEERAALYQPLNLIAVLPIIAATYGAAKPDAAFHEILVVGWDGAPLSTHEPEQCSVVLDLIATATARLQR